MPELIPRKQPSNGSDKSSETVTSKWAKLKQRARKGNLSWGDAPADVLHGAIASVTADGAAVLLTTTTDGGALVLRVLNGQESTPFYAADMDALLTMMGDLIETSKTA